MQNLLYYSFVSSAILTVLWGVYRLAHLHRLTHFRLNRCLLVAIMLIALILPAAAFIPRTAESITISADPAISIEALSVVLADEPAPAPAPAADRILHVASIVYVAGVAVNIIWLLAGLINVVRAIATGSRTRLAEGVTLVLHRREMMPFTWGRWIVMSESDHRRHGDMLKRHELAHLKAAHWIDMLLARILTCADWYCPASWLIARDIAETHEYEADSHVLKSDIRAADYQYLLVNKSTGTSYLNIVNPFNFSSLKNRITMMQKKPSPSRTRMRALALLPAAALVVYLAASPMLASAVGSVHPPEVRLAANAPAEDVSNSFGGSTHFVVDNSSAADSTTNSADSNVLDMITAVGVSSRNVQSSASDSEHTHNNMLVIVDGIIKTEQDLKEIASGDLESISVIKSPSQQRQYGAEDYDGVILVRTKSAASNPVEVAADILPKFPGGDDKLYAYLTSNLRYPAEAMKQGLHGRVTVKFLIEKDGSVSNPQIVRGKHELLDNEALRLVSGLPAFEPALKNGEPVRIWYTLPINFEFQNAETAPPATTTTPKPAQAVGQNEIAASYPGGDTEMFRFIARNLRYPEEAIKANRQGRVIVTFKVNTDGSLSDAKVMRNTTGSEALAQEALRVTGLLPKFNPGKLNGEPVAVWYAIPYNFKIQ